jgi:hypothetical protein
MLLKKSSKKVHQCFKCKKLDIKGSFAEVKAKIGQGSLPPSSRMAGENCCNPAK